MLGVVHVNNAILPRSLLVPPQCLTKPQIHCFRQNEPISSPHLSLERLLPTPALFFHRPHPASRSVLRRQCDGEHRVASRAESALPLLVSLGNMFSSWANDRTKESEQWRKGSLCMQENWKTNRVSRWILTDRQMVFKQRQISRRKTCEIVKNSAQRLTGYTLSLDLRALLCVLTFK